MKAFLHLLGRLEIKFVGGEFEALGIGDGVIGLDAEKHLVGVGLVLIEIVAVVGGHGLDAEFGCQFFHPLIDRSLFGDAVFLELEVEAVAKDSLEFLGLGAGPWHVVVADEPGDLAVEAGGEGDQTLVMGLNGLHVDTRLVIKTFKLGNRRQLHQVFVAGNIHGQEDNVEVALHLVAALAGSHIKLAADDRFYPRLFGLDVKLKGAIHRAMISDGDTVHPILLALVKEVGNTDGPIQQAILGMDVKMNKSSAHFVNYELGITNYELGRRKQGRMMKNNEGLRMWNSVVFNS